jgi:hypothetical protein
VAAVVAPFVSKPHRDSIARKGPKLLDQSVVEFSHPFPPKKLNNRRTPCQKLGPIPPNALGGVSQRDLFRIAEIPGVLSQPHFLDGGFSIEGRKRRSWIFRRSHERAKKNESGASMGLSTRMYGHLSSHGEFLAQPKCIEDVSRARERHSRAAHGSGCCLKKAMMRAVASAGYW